MLTTLTRELFMPRFLERDEGEREPPYEAYPWDGVSGVRPFSKLAATTTVGVYLSGSQSALMIHLPILRWGQPYKSLDSDRVLHFLTGEPVAEVSQATAGIIGRDMRFSHRARSVLRELPSAGSWRASSVPPTCSSTPTCRSAMARSHPPTSCVNNRPRPDCLNVCAG